MKYKIIATGSQGNAVILNDKILIDCGVSFKELKDYYKKLQVVLLTHEHSDHFNPITIKRLAMERPVLRFGCCRWLVKELVAAGVPKDNIDVYEIGKIYDYTTFKVCPVKLYHDVENCGYRVFVGIEKAIYATDTGTIAGITAKHYDLYLIEANYNTEEINKRIAEKQGTGEYIYEKRVMQCHLSKEQADEFLLENMANYSVYEYLHGHKNDEEITVTDDMLPF